MPLSHNQPKFSPAVVANEVLPLSHYTAIKAMGERRRKTDGRTVSPYAHAGPTNRGICATFATAFRNWRLKRNIPLRKIAKDLGLSIGTINSWESGRRFPTGRHLGMLVDYTGMPPCRLLCGITHKHVSSEGKLGMPTKRR